MIDKIFELLMTNPLVSIIGLVLIIGLAMILFKSQIKQYLINKFNLFTEDELKEFGKFSAKKFKRSQSLVDNFVEEWKQKKSNNNE